MTVAGKTAREAGRVAAPPPIAMLAELTHRCPLACPYCYNPLELVRANEELSTSEWIETFRQAAALGVLHLHLSGGEPASRLDLVELTEAAVSFGLYTNLITSGLGLTKARVDQLSAEGLDHVQLSIQGTKAASADHVSGYDGGHARKMAVADWLRNAGIPLTLNAVCHRQNMGEIEDIISLAVELGARRVEIATVQFHGWAMLNQQALMPTMAQVSKATRIVETMRAHLEGALVIDYVPADYYATYPKACMGGWGRAGFNVTPSGQVLPCHAAETINTSPLITSGRVPSARFGTMAAPSTPFAAMVGCRNSARAASARTSTLADADVRPWRLSAMLPRPIRFASNRHIGRLSTGASSSRPLLRFAIAECIKLDAAYPWEQTLSLGVLRHHHLEVPMADAQRNDRWFRLGSGRKSTMAERFLSYVKRFCPYLS